MNGFYRQLVGVLGRGIGYIARPLSTQDHTTQGKRLQIFILVPRVGFEPTTPVFERVKTVRALDHAATVISKNLSLAS
jgi:hypothetical protein